MPNFDQQRFKTELGKNLQELQGKKLEEVRSEITKYFQKAVLVDGATYSEILPFHNSSKSENTSPINIFGTQTVNAVYTEFNNALQVTLAALAAFDEECEEPHKFFLKEGGFEVGHFTDFRDLWLALTKGNEIKMAEKLVKTSSKSPEQLHEMSTNIHNLCSNPDGNRLLATELEKHIDPNKTTKGSNRHRFLAASSSEYKPLVNDGVEEESTCSRCEIL